MDMAIDFLFKSVECLLLIAMALLAIGVIGFLITVIASGVVNLFKSDGDIEYKED